MYLIIEVASSALAAFALYSAASSMLSQPLEYTGDQAESIVVIVATIAGLIVGALVFRLLWLPYSATERRYFWEQTLIGPARFSLPITTGPYLKLKLVNLFLAVCTRGLAWPWMTIRNIRFLTNRLTLTGADNFDEVVQAYDAAPPIGEGLDGFLDTGFDLGS